MDSGDALHSAVQRHRARYAKGAAPKGFSVPRSEDHARLEAVFREIGVKLSHCQALTRKMQSAAKQRSLFADRGAEINLQSATVKRTLAEAEAELNAVSAASAQSFGRGSAPHRHWEAVCRVFAEAMVQVATAQKSALRARLVTVQERAALASRPGGSIVTGSWVAPAGIEKAAAQLRARPARTGSPSSGPGSRAGTPTSAAAAAADAPVSNPFLSGVAPGSQAAGQGVRHRGGAHSGAGAAARGSSPLVAAGARAGSSGRGFGGGEGLTPGSARGRRGGGRSLFSQQQQSAAVHRRAVTRQRDAEAVERAVVEVGQVVQQMAHLVESQGEAVERIDSHISESKEDLWAAQQELSQLLGIVSRNRPILIAMLIVTAVVLVTMMLLGS